MRPKFRETIGRYRDNIVDQMKTESDDERLARLATSAQVEVERRAEALGAPVESQERVFELQQEKQRLMAELKHLLRVIDGQEAYEFQKRKQDRQVRFDASSGMYQVGDGRTQELATLGEVLFDNDFDAGYVMDVSDERIPRMTRKRFVIEQTKRQLQTLLNSQIIEEESSRPDLNPRVQEIYRGFEHRKESTQSGHLAERVIENILKRLSLDGVLPFEFALADVHQDVEQKIDFIINVRKRTRGVNVEALEAEAIGIQFTLNTSVEKTAYKAHQIEQVKKQGLQEIDDLVLVTMSLEQVRTIFYHWEERSSETGKTAGGPVTFMLPEEKEALVRGIFQQLFSQQELDAFADHLGQVFLLDQQRVQDEEHRLGIDWAEQRKKTTGQIKAERHIQERRALRNPSNSIDHTKSQGTSVNLRKTRVDIRPALLELLQTQFADKADAVLLEFQSRAMQSESSGQQIINEKLLDILNAVLKSHKMKKIQKGQGAMYFNVFPKESSEHKQDQ